MNDKQIQAKLDKLTALANELHEEAQRRYGGSGSLFYESDGNFHLMADDSTGAPADRQQHIRFTSNGYCRLGAGAW